MNITLKEEEEKAKSQNKTQLKVFYIKILTDKNKS